MNSDTTRAWPCHDKELERAYERIRRQETQLEALRPDPSHLGGHGCHLVRPVAGGAYEQGRELNAYLMVAAPACRRPCATQTSLTLPEAELQRTNLLLQQQANEDRDRTGCIPCIPARVGWAGAATAPGRRGRGSGCGVLAQCLR